MRSLLISFFDIVYFLIIVFIFTTWILFQIILNFASKPKKPYYDSFYFLNIKLVPYNNTFLKCILTLVHIIIFILVFVPFLKFLRILGLEYIFTKINNSTNSSLKFYFDLIYDSFNNFTNYKKVDINFYSEDEVLFAYYSMDNFASINNSDNLDLSGYIKTNISKYIRLLSTDDYHITNNSDKNSEDIKWTTIKAFLIALLIIMLF